MKKWKKYAALMGAAVILIIFCLPLWFALKADFSINLFMASLFAVLFVAVMGYVIWMLFKMLNKKEQDEPGNGRIRNIIFDVGNVLVDFEWQDYLKNFGFPTEEYAVIAEKVFKSEIWNERDRGLYTEEEYVSQMIAQAPEYSEDIKKVMAQSGRTIKRFPYAETWIKYLKSKGYHLYILSNYSELILEQTRKKELTFLKDMDGIIFSCEVKQIKPEPDIYQTLLSTYGLNPEESVFLDDRKANCKTAEDLGIHTIVFESFKQATAELEKLGVN